MEGGDFLGGECARRAAMDTVLVHAAPAQHVTGVWVEGALLFLGGLLALAVGFQSSVHRFRSFAQFTRGEYLDRQGCG